MWCESEKQCVAKNSYPVSFPYGQCRGWIQGQQCSGEYIDVKVALCYSMALFQFFLQFVSKAFLITCNIKLTMCHATFSTVTFEFFYHNFSFSSRERREMTKF